MQAKPKNDNDSLFDINVLLKETKGQLISECLFDVLNFTKNQRKNLMNFYPRI